MKKLVLVVTVIALVLVLAFPAYAEHTPEHRQQMRQALEDAYLVPGYGNEYGQLDIYNPITGEYHLAGLYGLAALCQNYGGYYYDGGDGYYYWHDCAGAMHEPTG